MSFQEKLLKWFQLFYYYCYYYNDDDNDDDYYYCYYYLFIYFAINLLYTERGTGSLT